MGPNGFWDHTQLQQRFGKCCSLSLSIFTSLSYSLTPLGTIKINMARCFWHKLLPGAALQPVLLPSLNLTECSCISCCILIHSLIHFHLLFLLKGQHPETRLLPKWCSLLLSKYDLSHASCPISFCKCSTRASNLKLLGKQSGTRGHRH